MNRYNSSTVNSTNFLFSPLHTIPFLYCKSYFGLLDYLLVIVAAQAQMLCSHFNHFSTNGARLQAITCSIIHYESFPLAR